MTKVILQLERIEEYREGNQLEAKAAQGGMPDTLWDSYSAFANTDGGCILLGVKEYDVKAMLELYDHPEELTFLDTEVSEKVSENGINVRKNNIPSENMSEKQSVLLQLSKIMSEKLSEIVIMAKSHEVISASDVVSLLFVDERQARRYLNRLVDLGYLVAEGVTKNKKYRYKA